MQFQGYPGSWTQRPPGTLILFEYQRELWLYPSCPGFCLGQGVPFPGKQGSEAPESTYPRGSIMGTSFLPVDLLALGGQPQIPRLPAPIYLSPSPPEVNWFAPEFTFSSSPFFFFTRHVASIKVKNQTWKNTTRYIHGSKPGRCFPSAGASDGLALGSSCSKVE